MTHPFHIYGIKPDLIRINRKRHFARRNFPYFAPDQGSAIALLVQWRCPNQNSGWLRTAFLAARQKRSEERRVGKEGRSRWLPYHLKKKQNHGNAQLASTSGRAPCAWPPHRSHDT